MLHFTSLFQNFGKQNSIQNLSKNNSYLNGLKKNYSFVYDEKTNKYEYHYCNGLDDDEDNSYGYKAGYWGWIRDRAADKKPNAQQPVANDFDGFWGAYRDSHLNLAQLSDFDSKLKNTEAKAQKSTKPRVHFSSLKDLSNTLDEDTLDYDENATSAAQRKLEYDYKRSKLKIQARKRDE
jgi:hypothetical protein